MRLTFSRRTAALDPVLMGDNLGDDSAETGVLSPPSPFSFTESPPAHVHS